MNEGYLQVAVREFRRMKGLADAAMEQVGDAQFFAAPVEGDNSVAVIVKHVAGNLISRWTDFLTADGEKPGRNRDLEFEITAEDTRTRLLAQWEQGWATLFGALQPLGFGDLERQITIRGEPLSVLQAINRQLTHYAYHVGQIVYVAKHYRGPAWRSLSIPKGQSQAFNANPAPYVKHA